MLTPRLPKCPLCGSPFERKFVVIDSPFRCPICDRYVCVSNSYSRSQILVSLLIAGVICYVFGARGANLALATILAWLPIIFVVVFWMMHFAPPSSIRLRTPERWDSASTGMTATTKPNDRELRCSRAPILSPGVGQGLAWLGRRLGTHAQARDTHTSLTLRK